MANMFDDSNLKILIIHEDKGEANRLISLLRSANYKPDAKYTDQEAVLTKLLQERSWDIVLCKIDSATLPPKAVISHIRRQNLDLPVILIDNDVDQSRIVEGLRLGATDVLVMDHDQHILQVVSRTLLNLDARRKLRKWKRKYFDSEKRAERLLHNSRDGIAIVQEGTYLHVNDSFAQVLDYPDGDSMICLPVIDTIADGHQNSLKPYLRHITDEDSFENREISFTALSNNEKEVPVQAIISQVEFEGEPALEFLIPQQFLSNSFIGIEEVPSTSSIQLNRLFEAINGAIRKAAQHISKAALLFIEIDRFTELQKRLGIEKLESLISELSNTLSIETGSRHSLHRYKDQNFILLMQNTSADTALRYAKTLCTHIDEKEFSIDNLSQHLTLSIGISIINETVTSVDGCIERSMTAVQKARKEFADGNNAALYELDMNDSEPDAEEIERLAREYLEKSYFQLSYQPIIALHGERQKIYEVLLQVAPAGNPKTLPNDFIAQVFNTKTALDIDRWVILESVKILVKQLKSEPEIKLFVNIGAATLCDDEFLPWLKIALKASGVATNKIVFQLREIDVTRYVTQARKFIELLQKINSEVALSRFGLSLEPMKLLDDLNVNYVKLDSQLVKKGFEDDLSDDMDNLLKALRDGEKHQVIVPFVESAKMIPSLWQMGVGYVQGHFLQPPTPGMDYDFDADQ